MSDGADYTQQQQQEEYHQWYLENKAKFDEKLGGKQDEVQRAKSD